MRPTVAEAQAQLAKDAITNPALVEIQLAVMTAARQAATGQNAAPASWVEKTRAAKPAHARPEAEQAAVLRHP